MCQRTPSPPHFGPLSPRVEGLASFRQPFEEVLISLVDRSSVRRVYNPGPVKVAPPGATSLVGSASILPCWEFGAGCSLRSMVRNPNANSQSTSGKPRCAGHSRKGMRNLHSLLQGLQDSGDRQRGRQVVQALLARQRLRDPRQPSPSVCGVQLPLANGASDASALEAGAMQDGGHRQSAE